MWRAAVATVSMCSALRRAWVVASLLWHCLALVLDDRCASEWEQQR